MCLRVPKPKEFAGGQKVCRIRALDLSFADELPQRCARILVVRPALDRDDAVTLNGSATTFSEFELQLRQLETDIQSCERKQGRHFARQRRERRLYPNSRMNTGMR